MTKAIFLAGIFSSSRSNPTPSDDLALQLSKAGWQVISSSRVRNRILRLLDMIMTAFRNKDKYSVAHISVFSGLAFIWAETIAWVLTRLGKPYVLTLHGGALPEFSKKSPNRVFRLLQSARGVTAPSGYLMERMKKYRADIQLLPNPLELSRYSFHLRPAARPRLIWLRAFHTVYNPELAVRVLANLVPEYPDIHLTMVGPDKKDGSLERTKALAKELDVERCISLNGGVPKPEVPSILNQADIFINTTNIDNTPVSVLEAMACGLCVVSTNVGGIPYLLEDAKDALLVPPAGAQAMAEAVRKILKEPPLAENLSRNARHKAEQLDWLKILPQWEKLFTETLKIP